MGHIDFLARSHTVQNQANMVVVERYAMIFGEKVAKNECLFSEEIEFFLALAKVSGSKYISKWYEQKYQ